MARALEIPAVVGVNDALEQIRTGDIARRRRPHAARSSSTRPTSRSATRASAPSSTSRSRGGSSRRATSPRVTADGVLVALQGQRRAPGRGDPRASITAREGIGLYRTEFLYIDRTTQPGEDEQYEVYRAIVEAVSPQPGHAAHVRHRRRQVREHVPDARRR